MNTLGFSPKEIGRLGRSPSVPTTASKKETPASLAYRPIDPSQTLQLPFHESQKAETPFANPIGGSVIIMTQSEAPSKLLSTERTPPSLSAAAAKPRYVPEAGEEKGTWQDGLVKIVDLEKVGIVKRRSEKEWMNEEAEPLKKKSKDHNWGSWAKKPKIEKLVTSWRPEIRDVRMGCR